MGLTAKHFRELALIARDHGDGTANVVTLANDLADFAARHNTRFDRERFLAACEIAPCRHCGVREYVCNNMGVPWCERCDTPSDTLD